MGVVADNKFGYSGSLIEKHLRDTMLYGLKNKIQYSAIAAAAARHDQEYSHLKTNEYDPNYS